MARKVSYESSGFSLGGLLPIAIVGGIGYAYWKGYFDNIIPNIFGTAIPKSVDDVASVLPNLPASWSGVTTAANEAANAAQIKYNQDYVLAVRANDSALAEKIRLAALQAQVVIGNPRDERTPINCLQPNFIKDGQCVDPFTLQPVTGVSGISGLGDLGRILDIDAFLEPTRMLRKGNHR